MKDVSYNKEILDLIRKLTKLTKQFVIRKEDGMVAIRATCEKSIFVELTTPEVNFDFDNEKIAFVENAYNNFYDFLTSFKKPILKQDKDKIVIQEGKSNIKFRLSDPSIVKNSFKSSKPFPSSAITLMISKDKFSNLKDMISMIATENVIFKINGNKAIVSVVNVNTENSYDLELETDIESKDALEMPMKATIFQSAPELNYKVHIIPGAFLFQSVNENFTLSLYTGQKV